MSPPLIFLFPTHPCFMIHLTLSFILNFGCHRRQSENFSLREIFWEFSPNPLILWVKESVQWWRGLTKKGHIGAWGGWPALDRRLVTPGFSSPFISQLCPFHVPKSHVALKAVGESKPCAAKDMLSTLHHTVCRAIVPLTSQVSLGHCLVQWFHRQNASNNWSSVIAPLWRFMEMIPIKDLAPGPIQSAR